MRRLLVLGVMTSVALACGGKDDGAGAGTTAPTTAGTHSAGAAAGTSGSGAVDSGAAGTTAGTSSTGTPDGGQHTDASTADASTPAADGGSDAGKPTPLTCGAPSKAVTFGNTCPSGTPVELKATQIGGDFAFPVFVTHAPDDTDRLFVVERFGTIQVVKNGAKLAQPLISLSVVSSQNEQGLLGMAFDPDFETTGRFFVDYIQMTTFGTRSVVQSYTVKTSNPDLADTTSKKLVLEVEDPEWNHNGGMLAFGPDHCLYVATGDGGGGDDTHTAHGADGNGQSLDVGLGKLLRIDVDHPTLGAPGNLQGAAIPWIWDLGLRNPWRFSFDRDTGDLYIGDVGQGRWEEVDVEPRGHGHNNYGWKFIEGTHCRGDVKGTATPMSCASHDYGDFVPPVHDYYHENGDNCVIGGYVYRGKNIPSLQGYYLYGDHGSNKVRAFVWDGTKACSAPLDLTSQLGLTGKITSFGEDADGELYVTTHQSDDNSQPGFVYRIDAK